MKYRPPCPAAPSPFAVRCAKFPPVPCCSRLIIFFFHDRRRHKIPFVDVEDVVRHHRDYEGKHNHKTQVTESVPVSSTFGSYTFWPH